jgi:hypothetical protein
MRNNLHLNLVYNFIEKKQADGQVISCYKIMHFFSEIGPVSETTLKELFKPYADDIINEALAFKNLDQLGEFALAVCVELSAPEIFVLSAQDYNIGLDSSNDVRSFREIFRRYGTCLENPQSGQKRKNIFSKLFDY